MPRAGFWAHPYPPICILYHKWGDGLMERLSTYFFYPLGSRQLRLTFPPQKGTDVWLLERWLNRIHQLQPGWSLVTSPEQGILSGQVMLQIRRLAKHLMVWQPWQIGDLTYLLFGQQTSQFQTEGRVFGFRPLLVGDTGNDVWVLQNRLAGSNRRLAMILSRPADGVYDRRTARLVRTFQRECHVAFPGLRATGQMFTDTMLAVWDRTILGGRLLSLGSRGLDVLALQELLAGFGYTLPLSGIFDIATAETLARWQLSNALPSTGVFAAEDCWHLGLARGY